MRTSALVLASLLVGGVAHAGAQAIKWPTPREKVDALYQRSQAKKSALIERRGAVLEDGASTATVVQAGVTSGFRFVERTPVSKSGSIGIAKVTQRGRTHLRLVLSAARIEHSGGFAAHISSTKYEAPAGKDPLPLYEERLPDGFVPGIGIQTSLGKDSEGASLAFGVVSAKGVPNSERRLNLSLPISGSWNGSEVRQIDRQLKLVAKAQRLLGKAQLNLDFDEIHGQEADVQKTLAKARQLLDRAER